MRTNSEGALVFCLTREGRRIGEVKLIENFMFLHKTVDTRIEKLLFLVFNKFRHSGREQKKPKRNNKMEREGGEGRLIVEEGLNVRWEEKE